MNPLSRLLPLFVLFVCSCRIASDDKYKPAPNPFFRMIQKEWNRKADSTSGVYYSRTREPQIEDRDMETYVFHWDTHWFNDLLYRLEKDKSGKMTLTTKFIAAERPSDSLQIDYKGQIYYMHSLEVIDSTIQAVSKQQWDVFLDQLEGSCFRELRSDDYKFLHPDFLRFQARSYARYEYSDSLRYYRVDQTSPYPGSFANAALYLCDISHLEIGRKMIASLYKFYKPGTLKNLKPSWE